MRLRHRRAAFAGVALALFLGAWVVATRPFGSPDEAAHYLRALGVTNGKLLGPRVPFFSFIPGAELAWARKDARGVLVPSAMSPPGEACANGRPVVAGVSCVEATHTGDYQPLPYLLPAVALSAASHATAGLWLSRAVSAAACLAFVLLMLATLWSGSTWSLVGPLAAISPMVLFVASVLNPNGLEIVASLAFAAAGLRIVRTPVDSPPWVWLALAISGMVTVLSWQLGPVFVALDVVVIAALLGSTPLHELLANRKRRLWTTAIALGASLCLYAIWALSSGVLHSTFHLFPFLHSLRLGVGQLNAVAHESIGVFGDLSIALPIAMYWIWWLFVIALVAAALVLGNRRERLVLGGVILLAFGFPVVFYAWTYRFSGFNLQGRYMIPLLALIPLVAGEVVHGARARIPDDLSTWLLAAFFATVALMQLAAWWISARTAAGAPASHWFLAHATWTPPLGWWPWTAIAILGCMTLLACGAEVLRGVVIQAARA